MACAGQRGSAISRIIVGLALIAGLALTTGTAAAAPQKKTKYVNTIVIGDSITAMGKPYLQPLRPTWIIDGVAGRNVRTLPGRIKSHLVNDGTPHRLIIALGQNPDPDWTKADYKAATDLLPASTTIYFISTYRDPEIFGQAAADTQATYTKWMREIAGDRPKTHMIPWRARVLDGSVQLADGSHPTDPEGTTYWANLVVNTVLKHEG